MKQLLLTLILPLMVVGATILAPLGTVAADPSDCPSGGSKGQVLQGVGETGSDCTDAGFSKAIGAIVSILSYVAGVIAIIMVIIAGIKFTTSGGDSAKAGSAKSTLTYALIGIAIAGLAQFLVHFVINKANP